HIKILLHQHCIQFFLKDIICLSLQLSLLFSFLKDFIVFEVILVCHTLFSLFFIRAILVIYYCSIFLSLLHHHHLSYHSCHLSSCLLFCLIYHITLFVTHICLCSLLKFITAVLILLLSLSISSVHLSCLHQI